MLGYPVDKLFEAWLSSSCLNYYLDKCVTCISKPD